MRRELDADYPGYRYHNECYSIVPLPYFKKHAYFFRAIKQIVYPTMVAMRERGLKEIQSRASLNNVYGNIDLAH